MALALLTGLGLAFSAGSLAAAWYLVRHLRQELPRGGEQGLLVSIAANRHRSAIMIRAGLGGRASSSPAT